MEVESGPRFRTERARAEMLAGALADALETVLIEHQDSLLLLRTLCAEQPAHATAANPESALVRERLKRSEARREQLLAELALVLPPSGDDPLGGDGDRDTHH
jgi:hypothetical protein